MSGRASVLQRHDSRVRNRDTSGNQPWRMALAACVALAPPGCVLITDIPGRVEKMVFLKNQYFSEGVRRAATGTALAYLSHRPDSEPVMETACWTSQQIGSTGRI